MSANQARPAVNEGQSSIMELTEPTKADWELARRIGAEFKAKPESRHIATEFALARLSASVRAVRPKSVLELGAGIGTITKLLLEHDMRPETVVSTEDHPVCLDALDRNLADIDRDGLHVVTSLDELLALDFTYELAICDGGFDDPRQYKGIREGALCFFEGSRGAHRRMLMSHLEPAGLAFEAHNFPRSGFRFFLKKKRNAPPGAWRRPKIKRRKGCWIGIVHPVAG